MCSALQQEKKEKELLYAHPFGSFTNEVLQKTEEKIATEAAILTCFVLFILNRIKTAYEQE